MHLQILIKIYLLNIVNSLWSIPIYFFLIQHDTKGIFLLVSSNFLFRSNDEMKKVIKNSRPNSITCCTPYYIPHQKSSLGESCLLFFLEFQFTPRQILTINTMVLSFHRQMIY